MVQNGQRTGSEQAANGRASGPVMESRVLAVLNHCGAHNLKPTYLFLGHALDLVQPTARAVIFIQESEGLKGVFATATIAFCLDRARINAAELGIKLRKGQVIRDHWEKRKWERRKWEKRKWEKRKWER